MPFNRKTVFLGLRWSFLVLLLVSLAFVIWTGEDQIDRESRFICPQGWWHTSSFWAHCAYPPIVISKYGAMYAGYAILALLLIQVAAPARKLLASQILLVALMAAPACELLLSGFSWVEAAKLFLVVVLALIFGMGARAGALPE